MLLLNENGLSDISEMVLMKYLATPQKTYMAMIEKLTMADQN